MKPCRMSNILRYLIVDDVEIDRLAIETQASKFPFLSKIASCAHALEAIELISVSKPDIVFADIEMPDINGLEFVRGLAGKVPVPVFVTTHPEFAMDGFEIEAFDYLLKPINPDRFYRCVSRIRDFFDLRSKSYAFDKEHNSNHLTIKQGYDKYKIFTPDILFLEAMKDYTKIITHASQYLVLGTFSNMLALLPKDKFTRIHRSYIVNREKIDAAVANKLFISNYEIPVGKSYKYALEGMF
jgi:DNA-binding LytR/AlgR family response regulator